MSGGWFGRKAKPPSDDPERPPKGPGSGTLGNPQRIQVSCYCCCGVHLPENTDNEETD